MTIREIAELAGVSTSTVSKIMNNKAEHITPETRARVLALAKEYHYVPYAAIKSASRTKTFIIGVLAKDITATNPILTGVMEAARGAGYSVLLLDSHNAPEQELKNIAALCSNGADGVLWEPVGGESMAHQRYFSENGIEVCCFTMGAREIPVTFSACQIDYPRLGYALAEALLRKKHTEVACLVKRNSLRDASVFEGFRQCLFDHDMPCAEDRALDPESPVLFSQVTDRKITGIVGAHFASTLRFYELANDMHASIPEDVSLVSLCAETNEDTAYPPISAVQIPYHAFGVYLCEAVIRQCEKKPAAPLQPLFSLPATLNHEKSIRPPAARMSKSLIAVGSLNVDTTLEVEELPSAGKTITISSSSVTPGGKGANQAIGAAKLGREVALIGKLGDDYEASLIYSELKKQQILAEGVARVTNTQTGRAYIYLYPDTESSIAVLSGANRCLLPEDIAGRMDAFRRAGYCMISTEIPMVTVMKTAEVARAYQVKTIVKPAANQELPPSLYALTDIFVPNRAEAATLCPGVSDVEKQAACFLERGCGTAIITLGHKGCYLRTNEMARYYPAADFAPVDSTGGADAFISALAAYLVIGCPLDKAIQIATYAAGFCVSRQGTAAALVDKTTLENHIRMRQPELLRF